ncbi:hypothetical protein [Sphingobacterium multivorum]|uniref:hypothetical protein n=1 Tax=Sphingobacterium multivorum TaxID=28454 RepID=UPI0036CEC563
MGKLFKGFVAVLGMVLFFAFGAFVANAAGFGEYAVHTGAVFTAMSLVPMDLSGTLATTPNVAALAGYAGKYEKKIFSALRNSLDLLKDTTVIPGIKNKLNLSKLVVAEGVRAYREAFDAGEDDLEYTPRVINTELLKRDIRINHLKYRETWMSEVMKPGVNPQDLPFAQYVFETIAKQVASEVNNNAYLAVKGDGSTVAKTFDGFGTIIAKEITDGNLVPVATGVPTANNAVSIAETMMKSMPVVYRNNGFDITCSYAFWDLYQDNYRERFGKELMTNSDGFYFIDSTKKKVKLKPVTWMNDSMRLISTPVENIITGVDAVADFDKILTETRFELLDIRMLFQLGSQFRDLEALRVNDQA